ncbi:hypothetical protein [Paenibacillus apiarius]|uniref:Uncharacterized protein n=1 Tax=Paenibacillus apiarius TaxID=46240 RepID=A0ABT4DPF2_9BACL|nr:hypothetical protein [Paenibacillus apiarius]MCY9517211.1 hypothetical protein [Paenibacillus apiarius]MCY9519194.1 hypothetical protein [Paenibacillus apiarius]MCY9555122.1 hypothetical protein [Paenibacillus apiarius]MCY9560010.1 hypothetical protein [Paenibacillus apiarius]MCY9683347.1 hypothetical protein [Paenibacillus apiarius]
MAAIALHGHRTDQSTKSGHVTYDIYRYEDDPRDGWYYSSSGSTGALITGTISSSSGSVVVNGTSICTVGDAVNETWVASPPVPSHSSYTEYRNVIPGTSGSGQGKITGGNTGNVYMNGKLIAVQGSAVTTHLGTTTKINGGNSTVMIGSS